MKKDFNFKEWKNYLPVPIFEEHPEYNDLYIKAWELARDHVKYIDGMPQNPYMDEAFCDTQVWIWDTCFMTLFCKFAQEVFPGVETFKNFYYVLDGEGILPEVIPTENEPFWTFAVPGQPKNIEVHIADNPPLFAWAEYENALIHGDKDYIKELLYNKKSLQKHYEWIENLTESVHFDGVHLPTYLQNKGDGFTWEGAASGMDNTPRGRIGEKAEGERPNNPNMLWIDAICQQTLSALMISRLFELVEDKEQTQIWNKKYQEKREIVNTLYWSDEDSFYYDIDVNDHHFYKVSTIASFWTLISEIANKEQAESLVKLISDPKKFGGQIPFVSLARDDADFTPYGQYWRGAVWMPSSYSTLRGLSKYGFHKEAHIAASKILKHMYRTYQEYEPHTIWEAYSPCETKPSTCTDGESIVRPDFCGWSALGPISIYIEYVLGFHSINAFEKVVEWEKPQDINGKIGIKNLRFREIVTDIVADGNICTVISNSAYTLKINGVAFDIHKGKTLIKLVNAKD